MFPGTLGLDSQHKQKHPKMIGLALIKDRQQQKLHEYSAILLPSDLLPSNCKHCSSQQEEEIKLGK